MRSPSPSRSSGLARSSETTVVPQRMTRIAWANGARVSISNDSGATGVTPRSRRRCRSPPEPAADGAADRESGAGSPAAKWRPATPTGSSPARGRGRRQHEVRWLRHLRASPGIDAQPHVGAAHCPVSVRDGTPGQGGERPVSHERRAGPGYRPPVVAHRSHRRDRLRQVHGLGAPRGARCPRHRRRCHHPGAPAARHRRCSRRCGTGSATAIIAADGRSTGRRSPTSCSPTPRRSRTSARSCTRPSAWRSPPGSRPRRERDEVVILDVPLLVESGRDDMAALVVVDVDPEVAVERLVSQRGMREDDVRARMANQADRADAAGRGGPRARQLRQHRRRSAPRSTALGPPPGAGLRQLGDQPPERQPEHRRERANDHPARGPLRGHVGAGGAVARPREHASRVGLVARGVVVAVGAGAVAAWRDGSAGRPVARQPHHGLGGGAGPRQPLAAGGDGGPRHPPGGGRRPRCGGAGTNRRSSPTGSSRLLGCACSGFYAFASFAKLNSAFFDRSTSCAVFYFSEATDPSGSRACSWTEQLGCSGA